METLTNKGKIIDLVRGQVTFANGEDGRMYTPPEQLPDPSPKYQYQSTTTVEEALNTPMASKRIQQWRERNNEAEEKTKWYQARGEIAHELTHYLITKEADNWDNPYEPELEAPVDKLKNLHFEEPPVNTPERINGKNTSNMDALEYAWFSAEWAAKHIAEQLNDIKTILFIEKYVLHEKYGYAGQFDIVYIDKNDEIVIADYKTSSGIFNIHRYQISAYYHALPKNILIDKAKKLHPNPINQDTDTHLRIIRAKPEYLEVAHQSDKYWRCGKEYQFEKFLEALDKFEEDWLPAKEINFD